MVTIKCNWTEQFFKEEWANIQIDVEAYPNKLKDVIKRTKNNVFSNFMIQIFFPDMLVLYLSLRCYTFNKQWINKTKTVSIFSSACKARKCEHIKKGGGEEKKKENS